MKRKIHTIVYLALLGTASLGLFACQERTAETTPASTTSSSVPGTTTSTGTTPKLPADGTTAADQTVPAISTPAVTDQPLSEADKKFITAAAQSGYAEVAASQMAKERSSSSLIKDFADMMVIEHSGADKDLRAIALKKDFDLPGNDAGKYKTDLDALSKLNGVAFDRAYVERVGISAHKEAISLFENAVNTSSDPAVKLFASNLLPNLKRHLELAENLPKL